MVNVPLFLSDVAGSEILLIMLFVLMFFGSKSIPGIARTMGRTMRQIKDASQEVQDEIRRSGDGIKKDFELQRMIDETRETMEKPFKEHAKTLDQAVNFEPPAAFTKPTMPTGPIDQVGNDELLTPEDEQPEAEQTEAGKKV